jgi:hypothetical protein
VLGALASITTLALRRVTILPLKLAGKAGLNWILLVDRAFSKE